MTYQPPASIPLDPYLPDAPPLEVARNLRQALGKRRSVRQFSDRDVPEELLRELITIAGSAPSGANKQPWRFVAVRDPELKHRIRLGAEEEERAFYARKASPEWLEDLRILGTDPEKPFLEEAPWLVVVFRLAFTDAGTQVYYANESIGIAVGMFLAAAHMCGLATLTHTPSPMKFLSEILERPSHERPYLLIPVGYPAQNAVVPDISRKRLEEILVVR